MIAVVRPISDSFERALTRADGPRPDLRRARREHDAYLAALAARVDEVIRVPAAHDQPDACFVEDMVVVIEDLAVLTRSGASSRRGEQPAVAAALPPTLRRVELPPGALLDGGDVLRVEDRVFVGQSSRTNALALDALRDLLAPRGFTIVPIPVPDALHLKCHCSTPGAGHVLLAEGFADPDPFAGLVLVSIPRAEAYAANVVGLGKDVLIAEGYPRVAAALKAHGFDPIPLPVTEIARADGSLTCLSILVD